MEATRLVYREQEQYNIEESESEGEDEAARPKSAPPMGDTNKRRTPTKTKDLSVRPRETMKSAPTLDNLDQTGPPPPQFRQMTHNDYDDLIRKMSEMKKKEEEYFRLLHDQKKINDDLKRTQFAQNARKERKDAEKKRKHDEYIRQQEEYTKKWRPGPLGQQIGQQRTNNRSSSQPPRRRQREEEEQSSDSAGEAEEEEEEEDDGNYGPTQNRGRIRRRNSDASDRGLWRTMFHVANALGNLNSQTRDQNDSVQDTEAHVSALSLIHI